MPNRVLRHAFLIAVALCATASSPARADEEGDHRAAAAAVLEALHSDDMVGNIVPAILAQVRLTLTHNDPTLGRQFDAIEPQLRADAEAKRSELKDKLVGVYARTFTGAELAEMLTYYKSPVGQRIIATQATINHDMLEAARDWGNGIGKAMMQAAAAELQGQPPAP